MRCGSQWTVPFLAVGVVADYNDSFVDACSQLPSLVDIDNLVVNFTQYVAANNSISWDGVPTVCANTPQQVSVDLCRVYMTVTTSERSGLRLEAWLPRDYNGRFLSTGNGGLGGCKYTGSAFVDFSFVVSGKMKAGPDTARTGT